MESSHELPEQLSVSNLRVSKQQKNDMSFRLDGSQSVLHYENQGLSMINGKLRNKLLNLQSHAQIDVQASRYKYFKKLDKKILQTARKLSLPCKDSTLCNVWFCSSLNK